MTGTAIKNRIILDNVKEYQAFRTRIRELRKTADMVGVLTKAYDMQSWTLRAIADLTATEMRNIEAHGKRSLKDI